MKKNTRSYTKMPKRSSTVSREKDGATSESVAILDVVFSSTLCKIEMEKR